MVQSQSLTTIEQTELTTHERTIEQGLKTFYEVGNALAVIRDKRLYRQSHSTFEDYCQERWNLSRPRAYELMNAAKTFTNLSAVADKQSLPTNERQVRPLAKLTPNEQVTIWQEALDQTPIGMPTAKQVTRLVEMHLAPPNNEPLQELVEDEYVVLDFPPKATFELSNPKPKLNQAGDINESKSFDRCQTPAHAIKPLLDIIPRDWLIWESACGDGNLVIAFGNHDYTITGTDLLTGANFFEVLIDCDCIVTNPPYSVKYQWLERCYTLGKPFALLMPGETYFSGTLQRLEAQYGQIELIRFDKRINFHMPNIGWNGSSAQFPTAWFTHGFNIGHQVSSVALDRDWL